MLNSGQTFGCTHYQQLVWEVFDHVIEGWEASGDKNTTFLETVKETQSKLSPGIIIGWFGQIQGTHTAATATYEITLLSQTQNGKLVGINPTTSIATFPTSSAGIPATASAHTCGIRPSQTPSMSV